jgi:catechol 2,3-dioxygenase-like lactoylglutathione lyase family enzyme
MLGVEEEEEDEMTKTGRSTHIGDVTGVAVTVADQDRAVEFYVGTLGFEVRRDVPMGTGGRWIQVARPGAQVTIALVAAEGTPGGVDTGITLATTDAEADHATLSDLGVDVDELLRWPGVPAMFIFRDPDGNQLKLMEAS